MTNSIGKFISNLVLKYGTQFGLASGLMIELKLKLTQ